MLRSENGNSIRRGQDPYRVISGQVISLNAQDTPDNLRKLTYKERGVCDALACV
jgi:hypothetical protein